MSSRNRDIQWKLTAGAFSAALFLSVHTTAAAAAAITASTAATAPAAAVQLTPDEIVRIALTDSYDIRQAEDLVAVRKAAETAAVSRQYVSVSSEIESMKNQTWYIREAGMKRTAAEWDLKETRESTAVEAQRLSFELLLDRREIALQQGRLSRLETQRANLEKKIALGREPATAMSAALIEIEVQHAALERLKLEEEQSLQALDRLLGRDPGTPLTVLGTPVPYTVRTTVDWTLAMKAMRTNSGELAGLDAEIVLLKAEKDIYEHFNDEDDYDADIADLREQISLAEWKRANRERELGWDLRTRWLEMEGDVAAVSLQALSLADLNDDLTAAQKKFAVGMAVQADIDLAKENVAFAELAADRLKLAYAMAAEAFGNALK